MAQTFKIKRSNTTSAPGSLAAGELAYSSNSNKLFIGHPSSSAVTTIGGALYVDLFPSDIDGGTLEAGKILVADSNSKINKLLTGNIRINNTAGQIDTSSGSLTLAPASNLVINTGTLDVSSSATEIKIVDNSATALTITEGANDVNYLTFDSTNSAEKIIFNKQIAVGTEYTLPTTDGSNGQALVTDGSGGVTFTDVAATLTVDSDSLSENVALLTDDLKILGGTGLDTTVAKSGTDVSLTVSIQNGGVDTAQLAGDAVTGGKIADNAINSEHITAGAVDNSHLSGSIANSKLANSSITIGDDSIALGASALRDINGLHSLDVDNLTLNGNTISSTDTNGDISLNPNGSGVVDVNNSRISNVTDPTQAQDAATKAYVDAVKQALDIKDSVHVATTANITLSGTQTIDGVAVEAGDRVLVKNQTAGDDNGIYVAAAGAWSRATDANTSSEVTPGMFVFVEEGTTNGDNGFVLTTDAPITLDTTPLTFTQFSGAGQITAGHGLNKSGNTLSVDEDNITLVADGTNLRIKGISATAVGDLLIGAASNGGYSRLVKPSGNATAHDYILSMNTSGSAQWSNILDGGTF